ncbi:type IV pilus assembly protein PilV [Dyella sp. OK004]|uniref:type IV pilus modification protein PilV n=1 Tax=Dyella sp. OK004 TaxID=1855292 RepID=UPI0008F273C1|nr:type IV pilus modification protein PilV [Dyella sp. OK004]SFS19183.1 type IV pilus assembly protein PilV [Dyella sp. OK004]
MRVGSRQRGVSLIEVLMAVLIFSIGLIGLAGLLVMAARSNQAAYLRTQVTFLAGSMADRMRANPVAVWNGAYNDINYPVTTAKSCDAAAACTPAEVAARDKFAWSSLLSAAVPGPKATIQCTGRDAVGFALTNDHINMRPPYGGNCVMRIQWQERKAGDKGANSESAQQTFAWEFQP